MKTSVALWLMVHLLAAFAPFAVVTADGRHAGSTNLNFPGWPEAFEGRKLVDIGLSEREKYFSADFPGKIARFTDGRRELILRWLAKPTRKLHPAADCLKGAGYQISPLPIAVGSSGRQWGCVKAEKGSEVLKVCERISGSGSAAWTDASSWFWSATLDKSSGPWWSITIAERL